MIGLPLEHVSIVADGRRYGGFRSLTLTESAEQAARHANFDCVLPKLQDIGSFFLRPSMPATVLISGELWGTGHIGSVSPSHDEEGGAISIEWDSKTQDTVDSSIDHPTGYAEKKTVLALAKEFESAGIEWLADLEGEIEEAFSVTPGETNFEAIERLARARGLLIYDDPKGRAIIASKPEGRHSGGLVLGTNIVSASSKLSEEGRHDPVKVRGQSAKGHGPAALRIEGKASDPGVGRKRPLIILQEGETSSAKAKKRAEWQVRRAAGRSREASVTTRGWRDQSGKLWTRNWLVALADPLILLEQDMIIKSVSFVQGPGEQGSTQATLNLADPRALGGPKGKGKSDAAWDTPEGEAEVTAQ